MLPIKPSNGKTDDTHQVCQKRLKPWRITLSPRKQKMMLKVSAERSGVLHLRLMQHFPYEGITYTVCDCLFGCLETNNMFTSETQGAFLVLLLGQCCVDNKVCSIYACVCVCKCVWSQVSQLLVKLQREAGLCNTHTHTSRSNYLSRNKHTHTFFFSGKTTRCLLSYLDNFALDF